MKKTLLYALSLSALVLGVTSCKQGKEPEKPKEDTTTVHSAMKTLAEASELRIETAGTYSSLREITYNSAVEFTKDACVYTVTTSADAANTVTGGLVNLEGVGVGSFFEEKGNIYSAGYVDQKVATSYEEFAITFSDFFNTFVEGKTAQKLKTEGTFDVKEYSLDLSVNADGEFTNEAAYYEMIYLSGMLRLGSFTSYITDMTFKASNGLLSLEISLGGKYSTYTISGSFATTFLPESTEYLAALDLTNAQFLEAVKSNKLEAHDDFKKFTEMVNSNTYSVRDVPLTGGNKADVYFSNEYWGYVIKGETTATDQYSFYAVNSAGDLYQVAATQQTEYKLISQRLATAAQLKQNGIEAQQYIQYQAKKFGLAYLQSGSAFTNYSFLGGSYGEYDNKGNKGIVVADYGNCFGFGTALDSVDVILLLTGYVETGVIYDYNKNGTEENLSDDKVFVSYFIGEGSIIPNDEVVYSHFGVEFGPVYNYLHSTAK